MPEPILSPEQCFPPARGDGPRCACYQSKGCQFPPCPGGWSDDMVFNVMCLCVSPLPGGMVRIALKSARTAKCFPPARGDGPIVG